MAPAPARSPMKKVRFTEEQMVAILREADKTPVAEVAKKHKISEQTIYNWRRHFGALGAGRRQAPAGAGSREREAQADAGRARSGDRHAQGDQPKKVVSSQARREQVALACEARPVAATCLRAARSGAIGAVVSVGAGRARCAGARSDEAACAAVSALRLSSDSHLPAAGRLST